MLRSLLRTPQGVPAPWPPAAGGSTADAPRTAPAARWLSRAAAAAAVALLAACGGGGGGGEPPAPPPVAQAPTITTQPAAVSVEAGQTASFSVQAAGSPPLAYQWRRGGTPINGANSAGYTTGTTTLADDGARFDVVVSNAAGSVTSAEVRLSVTAPAPVLAFTQQPASVTVAAGRSAQFSVAATCGGAAVSAFQWQRSNDGGTSFADIGGATAATYTLSATAGDNGAQLRASAACGGQTGRSAVATLTVTPAVVATPTVCTGANARGWCWVHPRPQGNALFDLLVDSPTQATVVGRAGTLLRTEDAGLTWGGVVPLASFGADPRHLNGIARVDTNRLVAVGDNALVSSADNGSVWMNNTPPPGLALRDLFFTSVAARGGRVLAAGYRADGTGIVLASSTGGSAWTQLSTLPREVFSLSILSDSVVLAGGRSMMARSTDGGLSWTEVRMTQTPASLDVRRIRAFDANTVLAAVFTGGNGLYRSTDGGLTWSLVSGDFINPFMSVDVRPATGVALAVGNNGAIFRSSDRGQTWSRVVQLDAPYYVLYDVRFLSDTVAVAVGGDGQFVRSTDAGLTWQTVSESTRLTDALNALPRDLHFGSPTVGLLVGQAGVLRTADGGQSWASLPAFDGKLVVGAAFADASTVVVLKRSDSSTSGEDFDLQRSTDGGLSFTPVAGAQVQSLRFNGAGVGLAVGRQGAVWRSADRGATWTQVRPNNFSEVPLWQVRWADNSTAFATSERQLLRSADGGQTWSPVALPTGAVITTVAFRSSTQGLGLGYNTADLNTPLLYVTGDGGVSWSVRTWNSLVGSSPAVAPLALDFAGPQTVLAVGSQLTGASGLRVSTLLRSTDGGMSWQREPLSADGAFELLHFTSATEGVMAGRGYGLLRTTTAGVR